MCRLEALDTMVFFVERDLPDKTSEQRFVMLSRDTMSLNLVVANDIQL